jgi:hypothetical protein
VSQDLPYFVTTYPSNVARSSIQPRLKKGTAVTLHAKQTHSGSIGIDISIFDPDATRPRVVSVAPRPLYLREGDPILTVRGVGEGGSRRVLWRLQVKVSQDLPTVLRISL